MSEEWGSAAGAADEIAARLRGKDALVIYNQGSVASFTAEAEAFAQPLKDFLDRGGIVILTDGWTGSGTKLPSAGYRLLGATILPISFATVVGNDMRMNPLMEDGTLDVHPLTEGVGTTYDLETGDPAISFFTSDRKIFKVYFSCREPPCSSLSVIDKVFPRATRGPVEVTVRDPEDADIAGAQVVAHHADGTVDGPVAVTGTTGTATRTVSEGGMITVGFTIESDDGMETTHILETVVAVQPFDTLALGVGFTGNNDGGQQEPSGEIKVQLPDKLPAISDEMPGTQYRARLVCTTSGAEQAVQGPGDCGDNWIGPLCTTPQNQGYWLLPAYDDCVFNGKVDVVLSASNENGQIGFQLLRGVGTTANAESWTGTDPPNFSIGVRRPPQSAAGVQMTTVFRLGDRYSGGEGAELQVPFSVSMPTANLFLPQNADSVGHVVLAGNQGSGTVLFHLNHSKSLDSASYDLQEELLPITSFSSGGMERPSISYQPKESDADGASAFLYWGDNGGENGGPSNVWAFIFPPDQSAILAPILPDEMASFRPTVEPLIGAGVIVESDLYVDYEDFRNRYRFPLVLPLDERDEFVLRVSAYGQAQIYVPIGD
jgi:hypothetical protein